MLNDFCKILAGANCEELASGIEQLAQVDLWEEDHFDKFEWENEFSRFNDNGVNRVLSECRRKLGQIGRSDHVPIVWQKGETMQNKLGLSAAGYWGPLKRAEERGFLIRINQHGTSGTGKLLILKMPQESEFHAIARAKGAADRFLAKKRTVPEFVVYALRIELENRIAAESATLSIGRCARDEKFRPENESLCRGSFSENENSCLCATKAPLYIGQEFNQESSREVSRERIASLTETPKIQPSPPPPSSSAELSSTHKNPRDVEEATKKLAQSIHDATDLRTVLKTLRSFINEIEQTLNANSRTESLGMPANPYPQNTSAKVQTAIDDTSDALDSGSMDVLQTDVETAQDSLEAFLSGLFEFYGLSVASKTVKLISASYEASVGDVPATRQDLRAKMVRLAESKFTAGKIAGYLIEDCPLPRVNTYYESKASAETQLPAENEHEASDVETDSTSIDLSVEEVPEFEPIREGLRNAVSSHNYKFWFKNLICIEMAAKMVLLAPDDFSAAWVTDNYSDLIANLIQNITGRECPVEIIPAQSFVHIDSRPHAAYERQL